MSKINVAIIGVGSMAKALVEGVSFYTKNPDEKTGLTHPLLGRYGVYDINFVAAFDVDERKVGKKLHEAISQGANITKKITDSVEYSAIVRRGPTLDGVIDEMRGSFVVESNAPVANVVNVLKESETDVVVNLVPTGSDQATYAYAEAALDAGCSFINCIPTPLVTIPDWRKRFEGKGLVLLGDDTKSQLGATMLNRFLLHLLKMRGIKVTKTEQENCGGNADHYNLLYRAKSKVTFHYTGEPSGHKNVNLKIEGEIFGRTPISINAVIEDEISINGAGTVVDAIRIAQLLKDTGQVKEAYKVCPFLMKSPPEPIDDTKAYCDFQQAMIKCTTIAVAGELNVT